MSDQATAPAAKAAEKYRTITRNIGDVLVSISLPADCPDPFVSLSVHSADTNDEQRDAMIRALGRSNLTDQARGSSRWLTREEADGRIRATVFLPDEATS